VAFQFNKKLEITIKHGQTMKIGVKMMKNVKKYLQSLKKCAIMHMFAWKPCPGGKLPLFFLTRDPHPNFDRSVGRPTDTDTPNLRKRGLRP
jgi:hypothetical protein